MSNISPTEMDLGEWRAVPRVPRRNIAPLARRNLWKELESLLVIVTCPACPTSLRRDVQTLLLMAAVAFLGERREFD